MTDRDKKPSRPPSESERARELEKKALEASEASRQKAAEVRLQIDEKLREFLDEEDDEDVTGVKDLRGMIGERPRESLPTVPSPLESKRGELAGYAPPAPGPETLRPVVKAVGEDSPLSSPGRILVVDDDAAILQVLSEVLVGEGYIVRDATDGLEALKAAIRSSPPPDVILLDIGLPELSGAAVAAALRIDRPELAEGIVLISAGTRDSVPAELLREFVFMGKPLDYDLLVETVRVRVREARLRASRPF